MEDNLKYFNALCAVPQDAQKHIGAGRLKGFTDINPIWRIKAMTEAFGPCGIGWKYEIVRQWQETFGQEVKAFTNIYLYIKVGDQWSEPIPGTGGATLVELNSKGAYVNDEGYKMSLTDAMSVAMKALGVGADIYYRQYETKYREAAAPQQPILPQPAQQQDPALQATIPGTDMTYNECLQGYALPAIKQATDKNSLKRIWDDYPYLQWVAMFKSAMTARKKELGIK